MIKTITTNELKGLFDRAEKFTLVNVLDRSSYEKEHICGSISIPYAEVEKNVQGILKNKEELVVTHCSGLKCNASLEIAEKLISMGYKNVLRYQGGIAEWKASGNCLAGTNYQKVA